MARTKVAGRAPVASSLSVATSSKPAKKKTGSAEPPKTASPSKATATDSKKVTKKPDAVVASNTVDMPRLPTSTESLPTLPETPAKARPPNGLTKRKRAEEEGDVAEGTPNGTSKRKKTDRSNEVYPLRRGKNNKVQQEDVSEDSLADSADDAQSEDVYLHGFSGEEDSSDDDSSLDGDILDVKALSSTVKNNVDVQQKLAKAKKNASNDRGVLYLGRVPHGFYEDQMKEYFAQFGNVTRLRLARNKKTGKSKHYAFIEFDSASVAKIVSETMDNYLIAGHLLQCKVVPPEKVHPDLWIGANKKWRLIPKGRLARLAHNKERTKTQQRRAEQRLLKRQKQKIEKLKAADIDYSFDNVGYTGQYETMKSDT